MNDSFQGVRETRKTPILPKLPNRASGYLGTLREAEAALLRSNSPRNKRTNGEGRQNLTKLATLINDFTVAISLKKPNFYP
jgi:hypothetical protein